MVIFFFITQVSHKVKVVKCYSLHKNIAPSMNRSFDEVWRTYLHKRMSQYLFDWFILHNVGQDI